MMLNEEEALALATTPEKIIDPETCSIVISYLNGVCVHLAHEEFDGQIAADNELAKLLHTEGKTNAVATVEWRLTEVYKKWRLLKLELTKLRSYRKILQRKEETLQFASRRTREYGNYPRAV